MKIKNFLAIGALALAAQGAQAQWAPIDVKMIEEMSMEMPLASESKPFSYETNNVKENMEIPLESDKKFSFEYKSEIEKNISDKLSNMRKSSVSSENKYRP